jgi:hypothetical protein
MIFLGAERSRSDMWSRWDHMSLSRDDINIVAGYGRPAEGRFIPVGEAWTLVGPMQDPALQ